MIMFQTLREFAAAAAAKLIELYQENIRLTENLEDEVQLRVGEVQAENEQLKAELEGKKQGDDLLLIDLQAQLEAAGIVLELPTEPDPTEPDGEVL